MIIYLPFFYLGTHLFLFNLKCISNLYGQSNYELIACSKKKDIIYNFFDIQLGLSGFIDSSLRTYLKFLYLKQSQRTNIFILKERVNINNPLYSIYNISNNFYKINKTSKIRLDLKQSKIMK